MTIPSTASSTGVIEAPAAAVWQVLADWGKLMDWYPSDPGNGLVPIAKTHLEGDPDSLPLCRVLTLPDGTTIREFLEIRDHIAKRIYYALPNDGGMDGIRNYWATTYVDAISATSCRVCCASFFDVVDPERVAEISAFFGDVVYARAVIGGLRKFCERLVATADATLNGERTAQVSTSG